MNPELICRGGMCMSFESCTTQGACQYKSSAQEAREKLDVVHRLDKMEERLRVLEIRGQ